MLCWLQSFIWYVRASFLHSSPETKEENGNLALAALYHASFWRKCAIPSYSFSYPILPSNRWESTGSNGPLLSLIPDSPQLHLIDD